MLEELEDLQAINQRLESATAHARIEWAFERFGEQLVMSTSFGVQSAALLHLANAVAPGIPVVFVDTGYLFPETYQFADKLANDLNLNLKVYSPLRTAAWQEALYGKRWEKDIEALEAYNLENKVEPMNRALIELKALGWMSGLRRAQSSTRTHLRPLERQNKMFKAYPIIDWSDRDIYKYLTGNNLSYHPLWDEGYVSVGDVHSTSKLLEGMTAEDTRFNGMKRECGLHEVSDRTDFQI
ncbi:phosphoadenylyl-sulfate reductase [Cerasicoccus arenae]|uniref:Phosphoadenosine 5'-phosphosulfate reductase n=1 Tax=Cerasicoccus arenae TaxID=424488 RepID=A0A8J3D949_9BACT|nr:phosphoadenylyl-sulfate reductase [Cerasicoccus arenae]GHB91337.1 phosphoadenosine phosphosulfate reductase [Cerasicoccus arenae]